MNEMNCCCAEECNKVTVCSKCIFFDKYNVECEKNHNPRPPYDKWFCADGEVGETV